MKKALAIVTLAVEQQTGPFQSKSDQKDTKALLDELIDSEAELEFYGHAAFIALTGRTE